MRQALHEAIRVRRIALGLSQVAVARRGGIQKRQVSRFEHGGDMTLSTFSRLAKALDLDLAPVPREDAAKFESLLKTRPEPAFPTHPISLLERYQVKDDEEPPNG